MAEIGARSSTSSRASSPSQAGTAAWSGAYGPPSWSSSNASSTTRSSPSRPPTVRGPAPPQLSASLWKMRRSVWRSRWAKRAVVLRCGCLHWAEPSADGKALAGAHFVNFSRTPCMVEMVAGKRNTLEIRPVSGHVWSPKDFHTRAGTNDPLVISLGNDDEACELWLERIKQHIDFAASGREDDPAFSMARTRCSTGGSTPFSSVEDLDLDELAVALPTNPVLDVDSTA